MVYWHDHHREDIGIPFSLRSLCLFRHHFEGREQLRMPTRSKSSPAWKPLPVHTYGRSCCGGLPSSAFESTLLLGARHDGIFGETLERSSRSNRCKLHAQYIPLWTAPILSLVVPQCGCGEACFEEVTSLLDNNSRSSRLPFDALRKCLGLRLYRTGFRYRHKKCVMCVLH